MTADEQVAELRAVLGLAQSVDLGRWALELLYALARVGELREQASEAGHNSDVPSAAAQRRYDEAFARELLLAAPIEAIVATALRDGDRWNPERCPLCGGDGTKSERARRHRRGCAARPVTEAPDART